VNRLYITSDVDEVRQIAKDYAKQNKLEYYSFRNNRDDINNILSIYENNDNSLVFLEGLTKSNVSNSLLKVLEDTKKNIHMFATTSTHDVSTPLKARFVVFFLNSHTNKAEDFIKTKNATKEQYSNLAFYVDLARCVVEQNKNMEHNLHVINNIIKDIKLTTNNTFWDYHYSVLKHNFRW